MQFRPKSESKTKKSQIKLAIQNAVKSSNRFNGKNIKSLINISSICKNKSKEELFNSNQISNLSSSSEKSKTNVLSEEVVLYENSVNHHSSKFQNNKNPKYIDYKLNLNMKQNNKEIFYLSDEEKNFYNKKPNRTDIVKPENELLLSSIPTPKDGFIKNKYKYLLENYMRIALNSSGR